jgi:hypothetical protein
MDSFLLASQRLKRNGQGETDFHYFELFLESVSGFPSLPSGMAGYYTVFDFTTTEGAWRKLRDYLARGEHPTSPFSGPAKGCLPEPANPQPPKPPFSPNNRTKQRSSSSGSPMHHEPLP